MDKKQIQAMRLLISKLSYEQKLRIIKALVRHNTFKIETIKKVFWENKKWMEQ